MKRRLKGSGRVCLGAKVCMIFWKFRILIPQSWKKNGWVIYFDGSYVIDPLGHPYTLYLWCVCNKWRLGWRSVFDNRGRDHRSAVLKI